MLPALHPVAARPGEGRQGRAVLSPQLRFVCSVLSGAGGSNHGFAACGSRGAHCPWVSMFSLSLGCQSFAAEAVGVVVSGTGDCLGTIWAMALPAQRPCSWKALQVMVPRWHQHCDLSWYLKCEDRVAPRWCPQAVQVLPHSSHQLYPGRAHRAARDQEWTRFPPAHGCWWQSRREGQCLACAAAAGPGCKDPKAAPMPACAQGLVGALQPPSAFTCPSAWVE